MKKQNLIIQAAVAGLFAATSLSAVAGAANGSPVPMAVQAVVSNATLIGTGSLTYTTALPISPGTVYLYVKLNNGASFSSAPPAGSLDVSNVGGGTFGTPVNTLVPTLSTDGTYAIYTLTITSTLPANAVFISAPSLGVTNVTNALAAAGAGRLTSTISIGSTSDLTNAQTDIDSASGDALLIMVAGEAFAALQSGDANFVANMAGAAVETKAIDDITSTGVQFTAGATSNTGGSLTLLNLGGYMFTDVAGVTGADAATAFSLATDYTAGYNAALTGNFAAAQGTGGSVFIASDNACTVPVAPGIINAAGTSVAFTGIPAAASGTPAYVCMQINTPGNTTPIPSTTPSLTVDLVGAAGTSADINTAPANLYALGINGTSHKVLTYFTAVDSGRTGFTSFIRVINTGGTTADITGAFIDATTGAAGPSGVIAPGVAAGGAVTLSSTQVETGVGVYPLRSVRPRLWLTAPTTFAVQSFILNNITGNFSEVSDPE